MSVKASGSLESSRKKIFTDTTYIMFRKCESNVFVLRRPI